MTKISLVISAYNEEENVKRFFSRCKEVFSGTDYEYEYVFINDGSTDHTQEKLNEITSEESESQVLTIELSRNFGKEGAMLAGMEKTTGDYIVIIDADLQQDPEYVLKMAEILDKKENTDCVACVPEKRKESRYMVTFKNIFYKLINSISDVRFEENASDFRMMRRNMLESVLELDEYYRFSKGIFSWVGYNTEYITYDVKERAAGETKWSFRKLVHYAIDGFVGFSTAPLKLASFIGTLGAIASIIYFIVVFIQRILGYINTISGYATIVSLILLIGSIQMILIGIMGEYIARSYMEVKNRPKYIVKKIINNK